MRIRKNAKWSSLQLLGCGDSSGSHSSGVDDGGGGQLLQLLLQPHVCQLNQSPWDAPLDLLQHHQREDSFTGTVNSLNDSAPTQDSFPDELEPRQKDKLIVKGKKVMGAGTATRKKKSRKGGGLVSNYDNATTVTKGGDAATTRRKRKKGVAANPYEFYYYTGFGPSWRKRGANGEDGQNGNFSIVTDNISSITDNASYTTNKFVDGDNMMDMVEESEDDDGESSGGGGGDGKKRMRKPVKARSLKSLM